MQDKKTVKKKKRKIRPIRANFVLYNTYKVFLSYIPAISSPYSFNQLAGITSKFSKCYSRSNEWSDQAACYTL